MSNKISITAIGSIIEYDEGQMVVINPGETGELTAAKAHAYIDAKQAKLAKAAKVKADPEPPTKDDQDATDPAANEALAGDAAKAGADEAPAA